MVAPPPGGPEDRTPPELISIAPPPGSTNLPDRFTIRLGFSEPIDQQSFIDALFITPSMPHLPRIKWKGGAAIIPVRLTETQLFIIITIGSGAKDLRGNRLQASITVAYTSGGQLPSGVIEGLVFSREALKNGAVGLWPAEEFPPLGPADTSAPYVTQVSADGKYRLEYIPPGKYRVLFWEDHNLDRRWAPPSDRLGLPWEDVEIDDGMNKWMGFVPAKQDTAPIRLLLASASDRRHITLRYSKRPNLAPEEFPVRVTIMDSSERPLRALSAWYDFPDSSRITLFTELQTPNMNYQLLAPGDTVWRSLTGSNVLDTVGPSVAAFRPQSGARDVPLNSGGWVAFNDGIENISFDTLFKLSVDDTLSISISAAMVEPNRIEWRPREPLPADKSVRLSFNFTRLSDLSGNRCRDSVWTSGFSTVNPTEMGEISGTVESKGKSPIIVLARPTAGGNRVDIAAPVAANGQFRLGPLTPGDYILWAFEDRNQDGDFNPGAISPWFFGERFSVSRDTVKVRSRWEAGGYKLKMN